MMRGWRETAKKPPSQRRSPSRTSPTPKTRCVVLRSAPVQTGHRLGLVAECLALQETAAYTAGQQCMTCATSSMKVVCLLSIHVSPCPHLAHLALYYPAALPSHAGPRMHESHCKATSLPTYPRSLLKCACPHAHAGGVGHPVVAPPTGCGGGGVHGGAVTLGARGTGRPAQQRLHPSLELQGRISGSTFALFLQHFSCIPCA
jgi:hypothetical protein